jgi:transposase InsO family protein
MVPLTRRTAEIVAQLFPPADRQAATELLVSDCADRLPLIRETTPEGLERIRFAALRLSAGRLSRLRDEVQLARVDWRDLLVAADFAHQTGAHLVWVPVPLTAETRDGWHRGDRLDGVAYVPDTAVRILGGWAAGQSGLVVDLVRVDPEPFYAVRLADQRVPEIPQSLLLGESGIR